MESLFADRIRRLSSPLEALPTGLPATLQKLEGIRAVIFDVYGTCMISGSGDIGNAAADPKVEALQEALKEQGVLLPEDLATEALARFYELIRHEHRRLKEQGVEFPEVRILDIWERWRREAQVEVNVPQLAIDVECRLNPVWPMPSLNSSLTDLQQRGLLLGIVSNAQVFTPCLFDALAERSLAEYGFAADHCVWSWKLQEAKPSTRLYRDLLGSLPEGMRAEECLYVGNDMRNDIAPSAACGMKTALFAGDKRSLRLREGDPIVGNTKPDLVLESLSQIAECI